MSIRAVPFGKYHLLERVNVGGMAEVYKAKMVGVEGFEKHLAIKRILPSIAADKDFINMFIDEAKISVQLNHANIAQIFELGRLGETYYIALEYVPGRDLRAVFERLRRRGETVPPELACYVMSRVAEGLDYAHRKKDAHGRELGIIHRDISPQNVLVSYEGEVKLIDFGIAKAANKIIKTQAGILKGKFGYMSPEQVRGLPLDRRSDIFACGIVLYELLAGDRLFTGESDYSVLEKVRAADVPRIGQVRRDIPPALERVVSKALARDPDERYHHASELVADLQRYLLARERLYTREDLAAFMKETFSEEWEREKRASQVDDIEFDEATPTPEAIDPHANEPIIRSRIGPDARPRLEGGPPRPSSPPAAMLSAKQPRRSPLAAAAMAAETDKVEVDPKLLRIADGADDETTTTETDPLSRLREGGDDLTPTPDDRFRNAAPPPPITEQPTRIGRKPSPPPIASQPPPVRALSEPPPRASKLPAITDNLPQVKSRLPPPIAAVEDEEPTVGAGFHPGMARSIADDGEGENTHVDVHRSTYKPRRRQPWLIVPVAGIVALGAGYIALQLSTPRDAPATPAPVDVGEVLAKEGPGFGSLKIVTTPSDAHLVVDGKLVRTSGDGPFVLDHVSVDGAHEIVARKDGFQEARLAVTVKKGEAHEVSLALKSKNPILTVKTKPHGAKLFVNGEELSRTPETIGTLAAGSYTVRVELKCYEPQEREVTLAADETVSFELAPQPGACVAPLPKNRPGEPGTLRLMSKPPAQIFVDGVDTGRKTPVIDMPLAPGMHAIKLVTDQKTTAEFEVEIKPAKVTTKFLSIGRGK